MANETIGRPIRKLNAPDLPEDARQFASGLLLVGREHHTERGQHHIETLVSKRERLSVNLTEGDGQPFRAALTARATLTRPVSVSTAPRSSTAVASSSPASSILPESFLF
jgi:hypothetical protein